MPPNIPRGALPYILYVVFKALVAFAVLLAKLGVPW